MSELNARKRLKDLRGNLSYHVFGEKVGLSDTTIMRLERGDQEFSVKIDDKITKALGLPKGYFLMLNQPIEHPKNLAKESYDKYIDALVNTLNGALQRSGRVSEKVAVYDATKYDSIDVPVVSLIPAGNLEIYEQLNIMEPLRLPFKECKGCIGVKVIGDSMEDLFFEGDILIIKDRSDVAPRDGKVYVVEWEDDDGRLDRAVKYVFKEKHGFRLASKNLKHAPFIVKHLKKVYRIVKYISDFRSDLA